jgi:hypothetical protein
MMVRAWGWQRRQNSTGTRVRVMCWRLWRELRLTEGQANQVTAVRDRMSAAALPLGAELIERELALDRLFAQGQITPELLAAETSAIGKIPAVCAPFTLLLTWKRGRL